MENTLYLSENGKQDLLESAKWAKFLAIVGFVGSGLLVVFAFGLSTLMSFLPNSESFESLGPSYFLGMTFIYVVMAVIYFFPCLYLFKFAKSTKLAILEEDNELLHLALFNMRKMFKFVGVMTLTILILYGVLIVFGVLAGGAAMLMY
ncbi:DUF5362 family protein [Arcticibacterium luteifluviistationis]|uniref:DUF5362 domain-containing protein n=1 Tax=Arcticibacterium luteifluviistationis TaxID=1784714 RepID=A0A2Z4G9I9_9BACT|nr:DUF5362 family protein [Arcticibacterium luteifluviistationis]AWV97887.1 hypothetical protein DJ013_06785 [Arcticibacterium luteifluviistationis]